MQQITPIEIRQKSFEKSFRGYNTDEVDAFLHSLAYVWEKLLGRLDDTEKTLESTSKEVKRLHGIENAILKAAKDAESNARNTIEQAQEKATIKLQEVNIEIEKRLQSAQENIKNLEKARTQKQRLQEDQATQRLAAIQKNIQEIETYRDTLLQKIRYLAEDMLARIQAPQDKVIHTMPNNKTISEDKSFSQPLSFLTKST